MVGAELKEDMTFCWVETIAPWSSWQSYRARPAPWPLVLPGAPIIALRGLPMLVHVAQVSSAADTKAMGSGGSPHSPLFQGNKFKMRDIWLGSTAKKDQGIIADEFRMQSSSKNGSSPEMS